MYDVIIVGAGPAGLTAGIYARRGMKKTLIIEALAYGGQIVNTLDIENYPGVAHVSGFDFATTLYNQAKDLGCEFIFEKVEEINNLEDYKGVKTSKNTYQAKTIIIATGSDNKKLNIEKEEELIGKGISYCATCDGNFYKDLDVAVVGGGNTAVEEALFLSNISHKVYLIHRREGFRADESLVNKLKEKDNVELLLNYNVTKLIGNDKLESIELTNTDNSTKELNVSGLFIAIGRNPNTINFKNILDLDNIGYIISDDNCHTKIAGIYVAGDNRVKDLRQLVTATSDGAIAATEAIKHLNEE